MADDPWMELRCAVRGFVLVCAREAVTHPYQTATFFLAPAIAVVVIQFFTGWPPDVR